MKTTLRTDITVREICEGFVYNELEGKGLFGLDGKLTIQPEYQRNYIYAEKNKDVPVINSLLKKYPLGVLFFNKIDDNNLEVLDGQQRVTSIGRFVTGKFHIVDENGMEQYFSSLPKEKQDTIMDSRLLIYECVGEEGEIRQWFKTVNIAGVPLNDQEINNAVYSGTFVTKCKEEFSNSRNANIQKWSTYIKGVANRQDFLAKAIDWASKGQIERYMSEHRHDDNIEGVKKHFNTVIDWISSVFKDVESEMRGREWGRLYELYHKKTYDPDTVWNQVKELYGDPYVKDRKGIFEYILGGSKDERLLDIRVFDDATKKKIYNEQTDEAKDKSISNCPLCAISRKSNKSKIYKLKEMEADHVAAWSKGGATAEENCEMLCRTHNRAKGNR